MPFAVHEYPFTVLEGHLDSFGHVNNARYLDLLEAARWDLMTGRGWGLKEIQERNQGPVVLELTIRFRRELLLRQAAVVRTQTVSVDGKIQTLKQDIVVPSTGVTASTALLKIAFFDTAARKLLEPTQEWLGAIGWTAD